MSVKGRVIRLERKRAERDAPVFYFVASEEVALRHGFHGAQYFPTEDPQDDPPVRCWLTFEEMLDEVDEEEARSASA